MKMVENNSSAWWAESLAGPFCIVSSQMGQLLLKKKLFVLFLFLYSLPATNQPSHLSAKENKQATQNIKEKHTKPKKPPNKSQQNKTPKLQPTKTQRTQPNSSSFTNFMPTSSLNWSGWCEKHWTGNICGRKIQCQSHGMQSNFARQWLIRATILRCASRESLSFCRKMLLLLQMLLKGILLENSP